MGSSQSTDGKITIDAQLVEEHLKKFTDTKNALSTVTAENAMLELNLRGKETELGKSKYDTKLFKERCTTLTSENARINIKLQEQIDSNKLDKFKLEDTKSTLLTLGNTLASLEQKSITLESKNHKLEEALRKEEVKNNVIRNELKQKDASVVEKNVSIAEYKKQLALWENKSESLEQKCIILESDLRQYRSNHSVQKIIDTHVQFDKFNSDIESISSNLARQITKYKDSNSETDLQKIICDYNNLQINLQERGITVSSQSFLEMVNKYRSLCSKNDKTYKQVLKKIYDIGKSSNNAVEQLETNIINDLDKVKPLIGTLAQNITAMRKESLMDCFIAEKSLYEDILKTAEEEKQKLSNILRASDQNPTNNIQNDSECNSDEDNNNVKNKPRKRDRSKRKSGRAVPNSDEHSIILFNFPEKKTIEEDLVEVRNFLQLYGVSSEDCVHGFRLGKIKNVENVRPIVVTFSKEEIANKILQKGSGRWYQGGYIRMKVFERKY